MSVDLVRCGQCFGGGRAADRPARGVAPYATTWTNFAGPCDMCDGLGFAHLDTDWRYSDDLALALREVGTTELKIRQTIESFRRAKEKLAAWYALSRANVIPLGRIFGYAGRRKPDETLPAGFGPRKRPLESLPGAGEWVPRRFDDFG